MNDRMQIAAMVMQGMLANSRMGVLEPWQYAEDAINCADALLKALEAALAGLVGLYDDPALPGEDHQGEIDRRLRRARDILNAARERQGEG